jgi:hypothetical protein
VSVLCWRVSGAVLARVRGALARVNDGMVACCVPFPGRGFFFYVVKSIGTPALHHSLYRASLGVQLTELIII